MSITGTGSSDTSFLAGFVTLLVLGGALVLSLIYSGWCDSWLSVILPPA